MTFLMICKTCDAEYEATREDIMRGSAWWTRCPACRPQPTEEGEGV
jgi:hypothetical protein